MRAALFGGPRSITVGERPDPVISAPTDAMVRGNHHLLFSHWCARPPIVVSLDLLLLRSGARQRYARQDRQRNTTHISSVNV